MIEWFDDEYDDIQDYINNLREIINNKDPFEMIAIPDVKYFIIENLYDEQKFSILKQLMEKCSLQTLEKILNEQYNQNG